MNNREKVSKECEKGNAVRKVCYVDVDYAEVFSDVDGDFLIAGKEADNTRLLEEILLEYMSRNDMPMIIFSGRPEHMEYLERKQDDRIKVYAPSNSGYYPFYGMSGQHILDLINLAGELLGYKAQMERVLRYGKALMDLVSFRERVSLKAMVEVLEHDEEELAGMAKEMNMSQENRSLLIRGKQQGEIYREIMKFMERVFQNVYTRENTEKSNLIMDLQNQCPVVAFYQISSNQRMMDEYLKQELHRVLKKVPKIRVILDEVVFSGETDVLLNYLFHKKCQGMVEIVAMSKNAKRMLPGMRFEFDNSCLFQHENPAVSEYLSKKLFGTYLYHYPVHDGVQTFARRIKTDKWHMEVEERLRVGTEDLEKDDEQEEKLAIKIKSKNYVCIVPAKKFFR